MRKTLLPTVLALTLLTVLALPLVASADSQTWTGWITDSNCGAKGANAAHKACALKCHKKGAALVLYTPDDKKLYQLSDQEMAMDNLGHEVEVTGELSGDTIQVASIAEHKEMDDGSMDNGSMDDGMDHGSMDDGSMGGGR